MNVIIVHGSWQSSDGWQPVAKLLHEQGYQVRLIDLPGHGSQSGQDSSTIHLQTYVDYVSQVIRQQAVDAPIALVGHSMAGMIISQVAECVPVEKLIYVAAFLPVNDENLLDIAKRSDIVGLSKNMIIDSNNQSISLIKEGLENIFYNGCDPQLINVAMSRLQDEPLLPFFEKVQLTEEKFGRIRKYYLECLKDLSISINLQRAMSARWDCQVYSLDSGHAPFYSVPKQLSELLIKCLGKTDG